MPERVQLRRTKGWRKPNGTIVVARPTKWGNPFKVGEEYSRDTIQFWILQETAPVDSFNNLTSVTPLDPQTVVDAHLSWLIEQPDLMLDLIPELAGHDLACWCPIGRPCHADTLLYLANPQDDPKE